MQKADLERLKGRYGIAPKRYRALLEAPMEVNERRLATALPSIVQFVNAELARAVHKVRITEAEVATNFLSEGGIALMQGSDVPGDGLSGFSIAGIDTLVDRYQSLKHLLPVTIRQRVEGGIDIETQMNEKGQEVHSVNNLSIEEATAGNAAMFADARVALVRDLTTKGIAWISLSARAQFFWTTVYYNAGYGTGRAVLDRQGVGAADKPWTQTDDYQAHSRNPLFNASWRTATWDLVSGGSTAVPMAKPQVATRTAPRSQLVNEAAIAYKSTFLPFVRDELPISAFRDVRQKWIVLVASDPEIGAKFPELAGYDRYLPYATNTITWINTVVDKGAYHDAAATIFAQMKKPFPQFSTLTLGGALNALESALEFSRQSVSHAHLSPVLDNIVTILRDSLSTLRLAGMTPEQRLQVVTTYQHELDPYIKGGKPLNEAAINEISFRASAVLADSQSPESNAITTRISNLFELIQYGRALSTVPAFATIRQQAALPPGIGFEGLSLQQAEILLKDVAEAAGSTSTETGDAWNECSRLLRDLRLLRESDAASQPPQ